MNIASVADVKAQLSAYVKKSRSGPIIVTRNGKPVAALVAVTDEDQLERLVLAHSPKFQSILGKSRRQIEETGGIPHDTFWRSVASGQHDDGGDIMATLQEYRGPLLSAHQRQFLTHLREKGFTLKCTRKEKKTLRIIDPDGKNRGYINSTVNSVSGKTGIFGYHFEKYDYCFQEQLDSFRQKYGESGWTPDVHTKDPNKLHIVVTDIELAYKVLGLCDV